MFQKINIDGGLRRRMASLLFLPKEDPASAIRWCMPSGSMAQHWPCGACSSLLRSLIFFADAFSQTSVLGGNKSTVGQWTPKSHSLSTAFFFASPACVSGWRGAGYGSSSLVTQHLEYRCPRNPSVPGHWWHHLHQVRTSLASVDMRLAFYVVAGRNHF